VRRVQCGRSSEAGRSRRLSTSPRTSRRDALGRVPHRAGDPSVLVVPLTTNLNRAHLAGSALLQATEGGLPDDSVALAFQMRAKRPTTLARQKVEREKGFEPSTSTLAKGLPPPWFRSHTEIIVES
jgi:mRNA-degrading endonuclease toxin of MazEF toxin-antitoxin module